MKENTSALKQTLIEEVSKYGDIVADWLLLLPNHIRKIEASLKQKSPQEARYILDHIRVENFNPQDLGTSEGVRSFNFLEMASNLLKIIPKLLSNDEV